MRIPFPVVRNVYGYSAIRFAKLLWLAALGLLSLLLPSTALAQTPVLTQHNNNARTGAYTTETLLTPANVNQNTFGKLFSYPVDGRVYAQPLYLPNVSIAGKGTHNVVFVATEHDSVYAFDADSNGGANSTPLWKITLLDSAHGAASGASTVPNSDISSADIVPEIGITGTPVIDPATGTLYVVGKTKEGTSASPVYVHRLHALSISNGAEKFGGPITISGSVSGTGNGSSGGVLPFDPKWENQRAGLLLQNGVVYIAYGSHGDNGPWHGWVFSYNAATLQKISVYCSTPNGSGSGVWMAGAGIAADVIDPVNKPYGRMFIATGNGSFSAAPPYSNSMSYGDDIIRLDLSGGAMTVQDSFTPLNESDLNSADLDVGSGGVLLLPDQSAGGHTHLLVQAGKEGKIYLVDRDNMGGFNSTSDQIVQEIPGATGGLWSIPAFWNNTLYTWGRWEFLRAFSLSNGKLSNAPIATGPQFSNFPGATPSVSSNGNSNGIVWAVRTESYNVPGNAVLHAFNASNIATELYNSSQNASRDAAGMATKFVVPTIANSKVYVGTAAELDVYGLLNATPTAASPVISPASQSFTGSLSVTITDSTAGAAIYYTTDGSAPTTSSTLYTGPFSVTTTQTITAIASASGFLQSLPSSQTYTLQNQVAAPTFSPAASSFSSPISVTLSDATSGAKIYYTTNGATPTVASTLYSSPITVSATTTVKAIAAVTGMSNSNVSSATYTYVPNQGGTGSNFVNGFSSAASVMTFNGFTGLADTRLQLTDGGFNEASSAWFNTPVNIQTFVNDFTFQIANPEADGFTFTIQNTGLNALGPAGGGLGYGPHLPGDPPGIGKSIAIKFDIYSNVDESSDSTGLYTNGASPTTPYVDLVAPGINLHSGDTFSVHMVYNGTTLTMTITDGVTNVSYTTSWTVNIPQIVGANTALVGFTGGTGGLAASQKIETWTFTPTTQSSQQVATPTFSPAAGTYLGTQTVSLSDSTAGATIFYTIDGTPPATSVGGSTAQYTGPLTVSSTRTIKAIATASGYSNSAVASATYTIQSQAAAPTFSPAGGSYSSSQTVTLSSSTSGSSIYYTLDGSTPATSAGGATILYSSPITLTATTTVKAIATASGFFASNVSSAVYTIATGGGSINFGNGFVGGGMILNGNTTLSGTRLRLTDGGTDEASSAWYSAQASVASFTNDFSFQLTPGTSPTADGFAFVMQGNNTTALGPKGGGLGYGPTTAGATAANSILKSVAIKFDLYSNSGETADSTGLYTNGASPTTPYVDLTNSGVDLHSGHIFNVHITYNGTALVMTITDTVTAASFTQSWPINLASTIGASTAYFGFTGGTGGLTAIQDIISWTYTSGSVNPTAATPTFSPAAGTYSSTQSVSLSDATSGATIYYTTNGSTPTTSSTKYTSPISVGATTTIKAIATASGYSNSAVASATYTIQLPAATPTFSPAAGTYASAQNVTISDATAGATIYYTTDGTTPTTASSKYTAAISVVSSKTIKAIATAAGFSTSAMGSAAYTIQSAAATPTFSPAAGTYTSAQSVALSDTTAGASIYYTTNGTTPTTASTNYTSPINVATTTTIKAIAAASGFNNSSVASATYTISAPTAISFGSGFTSSTGLQFNGGSALSGTRLRVTDGNISEARSVFWTTPLNVQSFTTDFTFQQAQGTNPTGDGLAFVLQNSGATAVGPLGGGLAYGPDSAGATGGIANSTAIKFDLYDNSGEGPNSTGLYTNGASPTTPATDLTSAGVNLHSGNIMRAHITYNGTTLTLTISDTVTGAEFATSWPLNIPTTIGSTTAYAGFTGGSGGATAVQDILTWKYTSGSPQAAVRYSTTGLTAVSSGPPFRSFAYSGFPDGSGTILDATAVGDFVTFTVNVAQAGSYDVSYSTKESTPRGTVQLTINGTNTGPVVDQYAPADTYSLFDLGNFNFSAAGNYSFKFAVTGKNVGSSGYPIAFDEIVLTPQ
jgi:Chitobiase/beta-hexosaminidase C-terminal domain/Bacterial lectin